MKQKISETRVMSQALTEYLQNTVHHKASHNSRDEA